MFSRITPDGTSSNLLQQGGRKVVRTTQSMFPACIQYGKSEKDGNEKEMQRL